MHIEICLMQTHNPNPYLIFVDSFRSIPSFFTNKVHSYIYF